MASPHGGRDLLRRWVRTCSAVLRPPRMHCEQTEDGLIHLPGHTVVLLRSPQAGGQLNPDTARPILDFSDGTVLGQLIRAW